jgi:transposase-like protein
MGIPPDSPPPGCGPLHDDDLALRAVFASARRRQDPRHAERVFLQAAEDLTLCSVAAWERLRSDGTTAEQLFAELQQTRFLLREARDQLEILRARMGREEPRHRRHYTPPLRFRILEYQRVYMLSVEETARRFCLTPQTIRNWMHELGRQPDGTKTVGKKIVSVPPIRRYSCAVRRLVQQMKDAGFGGKKKIAEILLRHSWKLSPRTIGRIIRETPSPPEPRVARAHATTVRGDHPNHLWLLDITRIPTLFPFLWLHLMVVLDACSRLPLAASIRIGEPSAQTAVCLLGMAIRIHGRPRHLVVDQGSQFTADKFKGFVKSTRSGSDTGPSAKPTPSDSSTGSSGHSSRASASPP